MIKFAALALAISASGMALSAHAATESIEFTLGRPPALADGSAPPGGQVPVGHWSDGSYATYVQTQVPARTPVVEHDSTFDLTSGDFSSTGLGHATSTIAESPGRPVSGAAQVRPGSMSADVTLHNTKAGENAMAGVIWKRNFELDAHSSVTFEGIARVSGSDSVLRGDGPSLSNECYAYSYVDHPADWKGLCGATLSATWLGGDTAKNLSITASLDNLTPEQRGAIDFETLAQARTNAFTYATDENGLMSLTITNSLDIVAQAAFSFNIDSQAVTGVVPEPHAYLGMLLGMGLVGTTVRRRSRWRSDGQA